jgi:tRNA threonylcarbamoyl adenosine modification protein (Sua5/YciO/YrdC/YwlC family)
MAIIKEILLNNPDHRVIDEAVQILKNNGIICYPTDTIYGLGVDLFSKKAMKKVAQLKKKPQLPLSFICSDFQMASQYARVDNFAFKIMKRCLPGPFTFVLPATNKVPDLLLYRQKTVGIRIPDCSFCTQMVKQLNRPVLSTSIPSEEGEILNDVSEIEKRYGHWIDLMIDGGRLDSIPSTVVRILDRGIEILREGKGPIDLIY